MKKMYGIVLTLSLLALGGCSDRYRYPCQDPANWNTDRCKKPICEVSKDCPEYIFESSGAPSNAPFEAERPIKNGECK